MALKYVCDVCDVDVEQYIEVAIPVDLVPDADTEDDVVTLQLCSLKHLGVAVEWLLGEALADGVTEATPEPQENEASRRMVRIPHEGVRGPDAVVTAPGVPGPGGYVFGSTPAEARVQPDDDIPMEGVNRR